MGRFQMDLGPLNNQSTRTCTAALHTRSGKEVETEGVSRRGSSSQLASAVTEAQDKDINFIGWQEIRFKDIRHRVVCRVSYPSDEHYMKRGYDPFCLSLHYVIFFSCLFFSCCCSS
jgi:hypothetical protein